MKRVFRKMITFAVVCAITACMMAPSVKAAGAVNELTGLAVSSGIQNQRPVAIVVDNEKTALKHYNTATADIVYELVNSTANGRITRLMCLYKDWQEMGQTGNIRSARPTNILMAQEYNAVLVHDGGPFYNDGYFANYNQHLSGGFSRVNNGKSREFTEYVYGSELVSRMNSAKLSSNYTVNVGNHFNFGTSSVLSAASTKSAASISLPFPHNSSRLAYNAGSGTYNYYEYGSQHVDADTGAAMSFTNVVLQSVPISQYDKNGYMIYNCIGSGEGYYISKGKAMSINWSKGSAAGKTTYTTSAGKAVTFGAGKTYIAFVPSDSWSSVSIK